MFSRDQSGPVNVGYDVYSRPRANKPTCYQGPSYAHFFQSYLEAFISEFLLLNSSSNSLCISFLQYFYLDDQNNISAEKDRNKEKILILKINDIIMTPVSFLPSVHSFLFNW